jgi:hypothetical protein
LEIFFPSAIFSLPKASHTKKPKAKAKAKIPSFSFKSPLITQWQTGWGRGPYVGNDIATGETWIPASLNANNLGETAVLPLGLSQSRKSRRAASRLAYVQVVIGFDLLSTGTH